MSELENMSAEAKAILDGHLGGDISKSFETGYNIAGLDQIGGAALRPQSLAQDVKNLTYGDQDFTIFPLLPRMQANSTVEQYVIQDGYGDAGSSRFVDETGISAINDPGVRQKLVRMKYVSDTRRISLVSMQVRNIADPMTFETENAMKVIAKTIEYGVFYGDSDLSSIGAGEGREFDGLAKLIDKQNVIDLRGEILSETKLNEAATRVAKGYGTPTDAFMPIGVQTEFVNNQLSRQYVLMQAPEGLSSGFNVQGFNSSRGHINLHGSTIMDNDRILDESVGLALNAPVAPTAVVAKVNAGAGQFTDADVAGDLNYRVRVSAAGAVKSATTAVTVKATDKKSEIALDVTVAGLYQAQPEFIEIFREDAESHTFFLIGRVPFFQAERKADGFHLAFVDKNDVMPGTADVFLGEMNQRTIALYELMPLLRLPLAQFNASVNFTELWYGALAVFAPKRWAHLKNVGYKVFG